MKLGRLPLARVGDEGELADRKDGAARVEDGAVETAVVVLEDPQARDLPRQPLCFGFAVAGRDTDEHEQPGADLAGDPLLDAHGRARDPLNHDPHVDPHYGR